MGTLIGRDSELRQIQHYLDRAKNEPVAGSLCLSGPSGIGKSAILTAATESAVSDGWIVVSVACHRIQAGLPFSVARRTFQALLKALGEKRQRYTSGLGDLESPDLDVALPGLVEGIVFDMPVLLVLDDIQWIDGESARLIHSIILHLADRSFVVVAAAQLSEVAANDVFAFESIVAIGELRPPDARRVVQAIFQNADASIVDEILAHAAGNTVDLIALAEAAHENAAGTPTEVASSMRNVVAKRVKTLERSERELLQLCSVMPEPFEYGLLSQFFPDEQHLTAMIERASGRYLVRTDGKLSFAHRAIATAVRETIPVEIPLRRKVIAAIESMPFPTTEHRFHVAEQALACDDQVLAHTYFLALARDGTERNLPRVVIEASEAALKIGPPPPESTVRFYADYAKAMHFIGRYADVIALTESVIHDLAQIDDAGYGELVLQLIVSQCFNDDIVGARATLARFAKSGQDAADREFIDAGALWFAVCEADDALFETIRQTFRVNDGPKNPEIRLRLAIVTAYLASRRGDYVAALAAVDEASREVRSVNSPVRNILDATAMFVEYDRHGTAVIERRVPDLTRKFSARNDSSYFLYFSLYGLLMSGKWVEGESSLYDAFRRAYNTVDRLALFSLVAMIAALRGVETPYDEEIDRHVQHFANGTAGTWYVPIAIWWSARCASKQPELAKRLFLRALERTAGPLEPQCRLPFMGFAIAAKRLGRPMLELFVSRAPWVDRTSVNQAESQLAMAFALDGLGQRDPQKSEQAIEACGALGLHLPALIARSAFSPKDSAAKSQLERLGIHLENAPDKNQQSSENAKLTTRERHVASVVAEGLTNRDIAERLVLSERTIEAHVANIFNKLNVSSRTQIAAWYLRSTAAG